MSYLTKEKIESGLSELYEIEEFTSEDHNGIKRIECSKIKDIFGYYDYLKLIDELPSIPYSTNFDLMKVIEYYEKSFTKAMSDAELASKTSVVDTSDWKAEDVYPG
jgi:hypothetical protein